MGKKDKVRVQICVGTACFVQGGADLLLYNEFLDQAVLGSCEIEGVSCIGGCKDEQSKERPPYVRIGEIVYGSVNQEKLCKLLAEATRA